MPSLSSCAGSFGILTLGSGEFDMKEKDLFDDEVDIYLGNYTCFKFIIKFIQFCIACLYVYISFPSDKY